MIQDTLFDMPEPAKGKRPPVPPVPPRPVIQADLGPCVKCKEPATLKSPSGDLYCPRHGHCMRDVYKTMEGVVVLDSKCRISVEKFVWHPRLGRYVCPCILEFEKKIEQIERSAS